MNLFFMLISLLLLIPNHLELVNNDDLHPEILPISEILGDVSMLQPKVSPDGDWIAWYHQYDGICLYQIASKISKCYEWQAEEALLMRDSAVAYQPSFHWSPDSTKIVFSRNINNGTPFDADIWIFNVLNGAFTNMTDDDFTEIALPDGVTGTDAHMDTLPVWLSSEQVIFIRFATQIESFNSQTDGWRRDPRVMQLDVSTGEVTVLLELGADFFPYIPLLSASPDARYLALWLVDKDGSRRALWLYHVESQQFAPILTDADIWALYDLDTYTINAVDMVWTQQGTMLISIMLVNILGHVNDYTVLSFDPQTNELKWLGEGLLVSPSVYNPLNDSLYFYHRLEDRQMAISYLSLSEGEIYTVPIDAPYLETPPKGSISYFSELGTAILHNQVWLAFP